MSKEARHLQPPGYWMHEESGVLRPAIDAYLARAEMSCEQIAAMRAYLRQWIMAPGWDCDPYAGPDERIDLALLRGRIETLTSRPAIAAWLSDAVELGIDPL